jgi:hypothetical protein
MNLAMNQDQEKHDTQNIVPLGSDEIRSILKSQSESVFEDKNISNNSNFVKKSLIDIALDFETRQNIKVNKEDEIIDEAPENNKNFHKENDVPSVKQNTDEAMLDENKESDNTKDIQAETEQPNNEVDLNTNSDTKINEPTEDIQSEKLAQDVSHTDIASNTQKQQEEIKADTKADEIIKTDKETQQALDSVRDAVSQSMNKSENENTNTLEENNELPNNESDTISNDLEDFKNILSSLPTLAEEAIYEIFQNKILEISHDLAGYQIDKMPEKYEKKIKSFLKNINCYQEKITVEVNDKDFEALSKIKNFNINENKKFFVSNKELSRGDIILNCDGMRYSEKSNYSG